MLLLILIFLHFVLLLFLRYSMPFYIHFLLCLQLCLKFLTCFSISLFIYTMFKQISNVIFLNMIKYQFIFHVLCVSLIIKHLIILFILSYFYFLILKLKLFINLINTLIIFIYIIKSYLLIILFIFQVNQQNYLISMGHFCFIIHRFILSYQVNINHDLLFHLQY